ncbi:hypothetical protein Ami103574_08905 [Aminipila butyrica]|uniref:Stage III sporulation protein AB n=1 Tax=Aminipila butyrica TaxID=433296 RepID=A0A858BX15_9FIRM|nr:stage III sporulation protein AB [Aminipila butyrica]QIB69440.1 hypothetical protein Ami103574_08905 [Aminipila butyrica]
MIAIALNTLIFVICCGLGYVKSQEYQCRVANLQSILEGLKGLEDEIAYRKTPLPDALEMVSQERAEQAAKHLFAKVAVDLKGAASSLAESWLIHTKELKEDCAFTSDDIAAIGDLGKALGGTDVYGQTNVLQRAYRQIEGQLEQAQQENQTKGKMYKSLGIAIGLTLVIILI